MTKKYYLAGPMSGIKSYNIPAFDKAASFLRNRGMQIVSPAELDDPEHRELYLASPDGHGVPGKHTWGDLLSRDVKLVSDVVDGVILLPGWEKSRGAKLEAYVGILNKKEFKHYLGDGRTVSADPGDILDEIYTNTDECYGPQYDEKRA